MPYKAVSTNKYCKDCRRIVQYEHSQYEKYDGTIGFMCPYKQTTEKQTAYLNKNGFVAPDNARDASEIIERLNPRKI